jgi:1-acyl-sn-glycerol-3-phosphate acyltransferase
VSRYILKREDSEWTLAGRAHAGHGGDLRWVLRQPAGTPFIRFAGWVVTKVLRRALARVSVDIPSFEAAVRAVPAGSPLVIAPTHRSYLDFILCSYLCFARPDLRIPIPHVAAAIEFARIPLVGRILSSLNAFYLQRGVGREDKELTRRVHELIRQGHTLEFFIEGQRSRSRAFLAPRRGMLRSIQATGESCALLPVAISYDRVPEEASFALELAGAPKPKMRLADLLGWTWRVHMACGAPIELDLGSEVHEVARTLMDALREATVCTDFHLRAFLARRPVDGADAAWLRREIETRGGKVLDSDHAPRGQLDAHVADTLSQHFAHRFRAGLGGDETTRRLLRALEDASAESGEKIP